MIWITYLWLALRSAIARLLIHLAFKLGAPERKLHRGPARTRKRLPRLAWTNVGLDPLPIVEPAAKVPHYSEIIQTQQEKHGKPIQPVHRRPGALPVPPGITCPYCKAPARFIYQNNGGRGQFRCKVCKHTFQRGTKPDRTRYRCPYCYRALQRIKHRKAFDVYKCTHKACPYRRRRLKRLSRNQRRILRTNPTALKLCYIFRKPNIDWKASPIQSPKPATVDLARIHNPMEIVGLCLYFFVHHGMSVRQIQQTLAELYNVRISHQTVLNYVEAAALRLLPLAFEAGLDVGHDWAVDETYIRIRSRWGYLFFAFSPSHKRIAAFVVSTQRDTEAACQLLAQLLRPNNPQDPSIPLLVTDGNPIYKLAVYFANQMGLPVSHKVIVGLSRGEDEPEEYRIFKQLVERLHRAFKDKYRHTTGFKSLHGAVVFAVLFALWFNYLHPRAGPTLPELDGIDYGPARWIVLLKRAEQIKP